jgi:adenine-specific DNA-methyltransferase
LSQLENFQKKLWLKKKFVLETNYCITLDRVPQELYPAIVANDAQKAEWMKLFAIDEIKAEKGNLIEGGSPAYSDPLTVEFLKANNKLVLDTKFFDEAFKARLLASIDNFDEQCDGLLIHSENFQALNLLQERYRERIDCIYVDPPYNTDAIPILYKNGYKESSWATLIADRLNLAYRILNDVKPICHAIDDAELDNLCQILKYCLPNYDVHKCVVEHYPGSGTGRSNVSRTHEYALFSVPNGLDILRGDVLESGERVRGFRRSGTGNNNFRRGRPNSFYAVLVDPETKEIKGFEAPPSDDQYPTENTNEGWVRIYPFGERHVGNDQKPERVWSLSYESAPKALEEGRLKCTDNMVIQRLYTDDERRELLPSIWQGAKFSAVSYGTNLIQAMFNDASAFSYPKSINTVKRAIDSMIHGLEEATVLDYFAGSGTTGHSVIELNREDDKNRKYILVEMGNYFETVTLPRLQKAAYSTEWLNGKPVERNKGISHCFKYIKLESYEDALSNIQLKRSAQQQMAFEQSDSFRESYMLGYMLKEESKNSPSLLNVSAFDNPFSYQLLVGTGSAGETQPVNVDLIETFNYLIGLKIKSIQTISGYRVIDGENLAGKKILVIWRKVCDLNMSDDEKISARTQSNEELDAFFKKQQYNTLDMEFDLIYVNGDNNLMNIPVTPEGEGTQPRYKVRLIEEEFKKLMFDVEGM